MGSRRSRKRRGKLIRMKVTPSLRLARHMAGEGADSRTIQRVRYDLGFHNEQYLVKPDSYLPHANPDNGAIPWAQAKPGSVIITLRDPVTRAGSMVHFKEMDSMGIEDPEGKGIFYTLKQKALPGRLGGEWDGLEASLVTIGTEQGQEYKGPVLERFRRSAKREDIRVLGRKSYPASSSDLVEVHLDPHSGLVICYVQQFRGPETRERKQDFYRNMEELLEGSDAPRLVDWSFE